MIAYILSICYYKDRIEYNTSKNSSTFGCISFAAGNYLPNRWLAKIEENLDTHIGK
jgi:hypothetical protein